MTGTHVQGISHIIFPAINRQVMTEEQVCEGWCREEWCREEWCSEERCLTPWSHKLNYHTLREKPVVIGQVVTLTNTGYSFETGSSFLGHLSPNWGCEDGGTLLHSVTKAVRFLRCAHSYFWRFH